VNGNTYVPDVVRNVAIVLALCNVKILIYEGAEESLLANVEKDFYFSKDGLGEKQEKYWNLYKEQGRLDESNIIPRSKMTAA
jgi:inosine-uridine nucleoside N-ribohydrolase